MKILAHNGHAKMLPMPTRLQGQTVEKGEHIFDKGILTMRDFVCFTKDSKVISKKTAFINSDFAIFCGEFSGRIKCLRDATKVMIGETAAFDLKARWSLPMISLDGWKARLLPKHWL